MEARALASQELVEQMKAEIAELKEQKVTEIEDGIGVS